MQRRSLPSVVAADVGASGRQDGVVAAVLALDGRLSRRGVVGLPSLMDRVSAWMDG